MTGYTNAEPKLCWVGRVAHKFGCLPSKSVTSTTTIHYPIAISPVDGGYGYSDDIKYKPGQRLPSPQPDEPKPQMTPHTTTYQYKSPRPPKSPKKTPVARTVPLSTLPLPVNGLPNHTPTATCVTLNVDLPPAIQTTHTPYLAPPPATCVTLNVDLPPVVQTTHTPYLAPSPATPRTPLQNAFPDSILQDLGNIAPDQYIWNTPRGALAWTPAAASHSPLPNPLADPTPYSPGIIDMGKGNDGFTGRGQIPSLISSGSSDSSSDFPDPDNRFEITLHRFLALNGPSSEETPIEWNVSHPANMARYVLDDAAYLARAHEPATDPPMKTLRIDFCFIDQPGMSWNWEPITIIKSRNIRITDVVHAIHDYFHIQLTHSEYDIVKSHGKRNARIVANSWRERVASQSGNDEAQSAVYHGGLRRVDCLGSCKNFVGLWVEGSQLKLGLRA